MPWGDRLRSLDRPSRHPGRAPGRLWPDVRRNSSMSTRRGMN